MASSWFRNAADWFGQIFTGVYKRDREEEVESEDQPTAKRVKREVSQETNEHAAHAETEAKEEKNEGGDGAITSRTTKGGANEPRSPPKASVANDVRLEESFVGGTTDKQVTSESNAEPAAEPAAESSAEPAAESSAEPAAESVVEPAVELAAEPAAEPEAEPEAEPVVEPAVDLATEPAAEPAARMITVPDTISTKTTKQAPINPAAAGKKNESHSKQLQISEPAKVSISIKATEQTAPSPRPSTVMAETQESKQQSAQAAYTASQAESPPVLYDQFTERIVVGRGIFIFSPMCQWMPVTGAVHYKLPYRETQTSVVPRGCAYAALGQLPKTAHFGVVCGYHPIFPRVSGDFYALGIVLKNEDNKVVVDFLRIGALSALTEQTRAALVRQLPGLISTTRLTELWLLSQGSLETSVDYRSNAAMDMESFLEEGPIVFHGNDGWSYASISCRTCWVLTSCLPKDRRRFVLVVGHPFSKHPTEYAIGVVVRFGEHLSLVAFRKSGLTTSLMPSTLWALSGSAQPTSRESFQVLRRDFWDQANMPMS